MESAREVPIELHGFKSHARSRDVLAPVRPVRHDRTAVSG